MAPTATSEAARGAEPGDRVARVRAFNRFYTNVIGLLREGLLRTPYSLTEARVIFELAQRAATQVADLRRDLDVDAGYMSRMLARLEADGLIARERSPADARRQVIHLSDRGRAAFEMLDQRSAEEVGKILTRLTDEQQRRLIGAMGTIQRLLADVHPPEAVALRPLSSGDYGWIVHRHGVLYAEEYGWDESFEALVAQIVAEYMEHRDPERENAWIAEVDGEPAGCVLCTKREQDVAQLRLLLVEPWARGSGVGTRLVDECVGFARQAGYGRIMLWTNGVLDDARRIYERAGFTLADEERHHSFGHDLVGQNWWKPL
jgi:DNA-binding MarR family transcriptional regulator/N-acetylglutamate synthase-like GNAT family acetyltransferase